VYCKITGNRKYEINIFNCPVLSSDLQTNGFEDREEYGRIILK
jgi:hypothetical protein